MLGVVVWSNERRCKAVIWCEDQGALAYLEGMTNLFRAGQWPEAGDLVELESVLEGGLRLARKVRMLSQGVGAALPQALRARAERKPVANPLGGCATMPTGPVSNCDRAVAGNHPGALYHKAVAVS